MAKIELTAYAFNGGELDPAMQARVDYQKYATGAAKIRNMIPRPTGGAWRRPGTRFVARALDNAKPTRLVPFRFSVQQTYMLELGDQAMRVIKDDGLVVYPVGHEREGEVVVVASPYNADDLARVRTTQTADVMYLVHPSYPMYKLSRFDHHDWRFEPLALGSEIIAAPSGLAITVDGRSGKRYAVTAVNPNGDESYSSNIVESATATGVTVPVPANVNALDIAACYEWWVKYYNQTWPAVWNVWGMNAGWYGNSVLYFLVNSLGYANLGTKSGVITLRRPNWTTIALSETTPAWIDEAISGINQGWGGILGTMRERIRKYGEDANAAAIGTGKITLHWQAVPEAARYRVYREEPLTNKGATFCRIAETEDTTLLDDVLAYDPAKSFVASDTNFAAPGDFPGAVAIFEQRLVVGRTDNQPGGFWGSRTGSFDNFTAHSPLQDDDSYHYVLDSREVNEIAWMVPMNSLLIGTAGGEFRAGGNQPLGPLTPDVHNQSNFGCAIMPPLVVGRSVVFVGRSRRVLRDFQYSLENDGFDGDSLTTLVEHLFADRVILDMCYQQEPESVIWAVMSDGALLSCTYLPKQNVVAWARHETRGRFEACASLVNIDGTDRVYFAARREINGAMVRLIEVMDMPMVPPDDEREAFHVDCGLTYRGTPTGTLRGLDHLEGCRVQVLADGVFVDGVTVKDGAFSLPAPAGVVHVGLGYESELVTLDLEPVMQGGGTLRHRPRNIVSVTPTLMKTVNGELAIVAKHQTAEPEWTPLRQLPAGENPARPQYFTGEARVTPFPAAEHNTTRVAIRCGAPTPLAVLGIVATGDVGDV